jgi:aspartate/methionine/tyrosine aminotransferase
MQPAMQPPMQPRMSVQPPDAPHHEPDFEALRERAFNLRWATVAPDVIPLTAADPDLPVAREVTGAIADYIARPHLSYGPACGLPPFREAVARHFAREKSAPGVDAARVIATNSAASAITLVARHLLTAGDEVVVQDPVDFLVAESARRAGAVIRRWEPTPGGSGGGSGAAGGSRRRFTAAGLRALLASPEGARVRLVSVCHPHNPLGSLWSAAEVAEIAVVVAAHGAALLSDEVWSDVLLDGAGFASFAGQVRPRFAPWVVYGLSKGYGLAGLRIGAVVAPDADAAAGFAQAQGFEHTIEGVSTLSQVAATAALGHAGAWRAEFLAHCTRQRDLAIGRLAALPGVRIDDAPAATFVLFCSIEGTGLSEDVLAERIERIARVKVVPGSPRWFGPGAAGHLRLSLATTRTVLEEALDRIVRAWPAIVAPDAGTATTAP